MISFIGNDFDIRARAAFSPAAAPKMKRYETISPLSLEKEKIVAKGHRGTVLSVEDHQDIGDLLIILLGMDGYDVKTLHDPIEGLEMAKQRSFDLYLIGDLWPLGASIELAREIRKFDIFTPLILHSARAHQADIRRGLSVGAQAYLVKPCDPDDILKAVGRHIDQKILRHV